MSGFWEKYKDPRWQRRRLERMEHADFTCEHCQETSKTLNVHHKLYRKGADPWDYNDLELMCLCEDCHEEWHNAKDNFNVALQWISLSDYRELVGYAVGLAMKTCSPDVTAPYKTPEGILGTARALGISEAQLRKAINTDNRAFAGDLQALHLAVSKGKKRAR
jgi:hypothetical protein